MQRWHAGVSHLRVLHYDALTVCAVQVRTRTFPTFSRTIFADRSRLSLIMKPREIMSLQRRRSDNVLPYVHGRSRCSLADFVLGTASKCSIYKFGV